MGNQKLSRAFILFQCEAILVSFHFTLFFSLCASKAVIRERFLHYRMTIVKTRIEFDTRKVVMTVVMTVKIDGLERGRMSDTVRYSENSVENHPQVK